MNRSLTSVLWILLMLASIPYVLAQESGWPRTVPLEQGMVTIYTLQVDEMNDDIIHFRAALAYRATVGSEPVFGAGWFESRVEIDRSSGIVHPTDLKVTQTRFPAGTDDVQSELSAVLAQTSAAWNLDFTLDELETALKTVEAESKAEENLNTAPPRIVYRDHPALLISLDGEAVLRVIENSTLQAVINTPYPLIYDGRHYYLNAASGVWYRATEATGPYQFEASPPADIAAMVKDDEAKADEQPVETITAANAPEIVVSTVPTELIVTEGPAAFVPLVDDLLVLQNSDDDVFMHVSGQEFFIVLAGRWYRAATLNGPWTYQPADELPPAFANIPSDSNQADSRVYVAGTEEAREAVLDAQVPKTAAVARGVVDIDVDYDGDPVYEPVDGTDLVYIRNTGSTVIQSDGWYYLVEDGVWYMSSTPNGPWQVADHRPLQVDTILPTSPVYNVKYVRVYDSTPSVVYVGYTPGYTGSYVYRNTIFYGSGWYYSPWISPRFYYPRHSTWGFNVSYNPWIGWNFGLSWGWGPFSVGYYSGGFWHRDHYWHHRHHGRWGPRGYRPRPVHYGHGRNRYADSGHRRNSNGNSYRDGGQRTRVADTRDEQTRRRGGREQSYARRDKAGRSRTQPVTSSEMRAKAELRDVNSEASRRRLLADNNGDVYRRADRAPNRALVRTTERVPQPTADRNDTNRRASKSAKNPKSRTTPLPRSRVQNERQEGGRASDESKVRRTRQSAPVASSRQLQTRSADRRASQRSVRVAEPRARAAKPVSIIAPARTVQAGNRGNNSSQRSVRVVESRVKAGKQDSIIAPVRTVQAGNRGNNSSQRSSRVVSAPVQKQNISRPAPQPQSPRSSGLHNSTPVERAPQRSAQRTGSKRNGSNPGGKQRVTGNRSKRH